jgi:electron transport complex protein RnfB
VNSIVTAAAIMGGLGMLFGIILAVAYRFLRVEEDPRLVLVSELLPGSNCGACGEPGCQGFAEALIEGRRAPSGCTVATPDAVEKIAGVLGVDAGSQQKRVARLHCAGGRSLAPQIAAYEGFDSCRAAALIGGGGKGCSWGCLGHGDCQVACTFDAITMNDDGLPVVDVERCTACADCVDICPRDLFEILPLNHHLIVQCSAPLAGEAARELCRVACDACGRCAQDAPEGLVTMQGDLPRVDYAAGGPATPSITLRCPTSAIVWVEERQFREQQLGSS